MIEEIINVIICDDIKEFNNDITEIIESFIDKTKYKIEIHRFYDYDDDFLKIICQKMENKFYVLDIFTEHRSGLEIARMIRKSDHNSMITFITSFYNDVEQQIIKGKYMYLSFINKLNDYKSELKEAFQYYLDTKNYNNILNFKIFGEPILLETKDINYISYENRKINFNMTYGKIYLMPKSLKFIFELLDERFVYSHKSCIVNLDNIEDIDKKKKIIIFKNNAITDIVTKEKINGLIKKWKAYRLKRD